MSCLNLVLPGLIWQNNADYPYLQSHFIIPNFTKLLSKSKISYAKLLVSDFLYAHDFNGELSLAGSYAQKLGITGFQSYLLIEPTHLRVDRDRLLICESELLQLNDEETMFAIGELNRHFIDDLQIFRLENELWLVGLKFKLHDDLISYPICDIVGENIDDYLPTGTDRLRLHKLMNEMQMLLFNLPMNNQREQDRLLALNSIWLWDISKAKLSFKFHDSPIFSNNPMFGKQYDKLEKVIAINDSYLLLDDVFYSACYRDSYTWINKLNQLDQGLMSEILFAFKNKKLTQLNVYVPNIIGGVRFSLSRYDLWKFWRRNIDWSQIIEN